MLSPLARTVWIGILCLADACEQARAGDATSKPSKPDAPFKGASLPTPPQQGKPWTPPPVKLPPEWAEGVRNLVKQGYADPRGCEYREVKLAFAGTTHAWLIPRDASKSTGGERFAVTWDGMVYPVVGIGAPANVKDDARALLAEAAKHPSRRVQTMVFSFNDQGFGSGPGEMREVWQDGIARRAAGCSERELVSSHSLLGFKCCTLMLLGEGALAERIWNVWIQQEGDWSPKAAQRVFEEEWAWALFHRATEAHHRGDDSIAALSAKCLVALLHGESHPFFKTWPNRIIEDDSRRLRTKRVRRALEIGLDKLPDQSQRIAALIRDLEVVEAGDSPFLGMGGFGPTPPDTIVASSPIVKALVNEGLPAVEPLLECLAADRRFTRATGVTGRWSDRFFIVTVDQAAYAALRQILQVCNFGPLTENGYGPSNLTEWDMEHRRAVATEIRRFWLKHGRQTGAEIWLGVLADPEATHAQWLEAARAIVAPPPPDFSRLSSGETPDDEDADEKQRMAGESLRSKRNPTVAEIMARRADELDDLARLGGFLGGFSPERDLSMTMCLAKWDAKAAVPTVRHRFAEWRRCTRKRSEKTSTWDDRLPEPAESLALLTDACIRAGDDSIAEDYAAWMREMPERKLFDLRYPGLLLFVPVWRHPENQKLAELARWAFLSEKSSWRPDYKSARPWHVDWPPPLLAVPAFREFLKRELADTTVIGAASFDFHDYQMSTKIDGIPGETGASSSNCTVYAPDADVPQSLTVPLRECDKCAYEISKLEGAPRIEFYWSDKKREEARAEIAKFIDRWSDAFRDRRTTVENFDLEFYQFGQREVGFRLPRLAHPARAKDVAAGRAIFSLEDRNGGRVRVVPLKPFPRIARWKKLEKFRFREAVPLVPAGEFPNLSVERIKSLPHESFDREGRIWQAEEILIDGKWRRFYGFVGNHIIAKVPAEEIQLLDDFSSAHAMTQ